jgi:hypothetical protein
VRDEKTAVSGPWIGGVTALAARAGHEIAVVDDEGQAEAIFQLVLPLLEHRGGAGYDDAPHLLAHQQFAQDKTGLDGLAEADVVSDEQVDPRQRQRLAQRFELIEGHVDAGAEGRLEQAGIGRRNAVPSNRAQVGGKPLRRVESALAVAPPRALVKDAGVHLLFPQDLEAIGLRVVIEAGKPDQRLLPRLRRRRNLLDQVMARPHRHNLPGRRNSPPRRRADWIGSNPVGSGSP